MSSPIKMNSCLICDDHALVREALAGTIRMSWPEATICEASDFPSAWAAAKQPPDFCLADLVMPGASPLDGIRGLMQAAPQMPIVVVTGTENDALMLDLLKLGVAGFVPKSASGSIVEAAVHLVLAGGRYMPVRLADIVAAGLQAAGTKTGDRDGLVQSAPEGPNGSLAYKLGAENADPAERLSVRQREVLKLVSEGQSNKEIARALGLAPSTVKTHLEHLLTALGVSNRTEAASKAKDIRLL